MSALTKEWLLKTIAELEEDRDATPGIVNEDAAMALAAMKLALASLEAEAVSINDDMAYAFHHALSDSSLGADEVEEIKAGLRAAFANVTAPPAPVSVPEGVLKSLLPDVEKSEFWFEHDGKILFEGVKFNNAVFDACQAAMLQGAEPSPATDNTAQQFEALATSNAHDCLWSYDSHQGTWHGKCGVYWVFMDDGPDENGMKFCPGCGKPVASTNAGSGKP